MNDMEAETVADRAYRMVELWPTFHDALGCLDCDRLFRTTNECPFCGSKSLMNVATFLLGD